MTTPGNTACFNSNDDDNDTPSFAVKILREITATAYGHTRSKLINKLKPNNKIIPSHTTS